MTTQEAGEQTIIYFKQRIAYYQDQLTMTTDEYTRCCASNLIHFYDLAISTLKKQIPNQSSCFWCVDKSPMIVEKETDRGFQGDVLLSEIKFCPYCGQRLE